MKEQINKNNENLRERKEAYEAPKCEIIEMQNEGDIMTPSASAVHGGYQEEDSFSW